MPGVIESYIHTGNQIGVLVELNCQSKIAAKTTEFKTLAKEIAMQIAASPKVRYIKIDEIPDRIIRQIELTSEGDRDLLAQYLQALSLYDQFYLRDDNITIADLIKLNIIKLSENIAVKRFQRFAVEDGDLSSDPSSGVPANPLPNSPNPLTDEAETDF